MDTPKAHDEAGCHACACIKLRHASGGTLDPNATLSPAARLRSADFVTLPDAAHEALARKLEALSLRDAVVKALDAAKAGDPLQLLAVEDYERAMGLEVRS